MKRRFGLLALMGWIGLLLIHPSETSIKNLDLKEEESKNLVQSSFIQKPLKTNRDKTIENELLFSIKRDVVTINKSEGGSLKEINNSNQDKNNKYWSEWKSIKRKIIKSDEESRLEENLKKNEGLLKITKEVFMSGGHETDLNEAVDFIVEALSDDPQKAQIELTPLYSGDSYKNEKIFEYQAELAFWLIQQNPDHQKWIQLIWKDDRSEEILKRIVSYNGRTIN